MWALVLHDNKLEAQERSMTDTIAAIDPVAPIDWAISIPLPSYHHLHGSSKRVNGVPLSSYQ